MTTRRDFLKGGLAAGIVFCGCGMVHNAQAQAPRQKLPAETTFMSGLTKQQNWKSLHLQLNYNNQTTWLQS